MSTLRIAFYVWKAYQYYWIGSNSYQYVKTAAQCYHLTHPTVRWCYQKIYKKNPESWNQEIRAKEYRLLAEMNALQEEVNNSSRINSRPRYKQKIPKTDSGWEII